LGPGHHVPVTRLGIGEDAGLDGFVLAWGGHLRIHPALGWRFGWQADGLA
jgi:hypothetical protein